MIKITSPVSILEFGSSHLRLAVFDKSIPNQKVFYEERNNITINKIPNEDNSLFKLIINAEKDIGQHLNEIILVLDSTSVHSLDFSLKKNYEKRLFLKEDLDQFISESEQIVKKFNKDKNILHTIISKITIDDEVFEELKDISIKVSKVIIEFKYIIIEELDLNFIKNLLLSKHISIKNIYCTSYINSLNLKNKIEKSKYISFIDIGLNKSSISIFNENKLVYINNTYIAGKHITKDISKILDLDYNTAELEKLKFSKLNKNSDNGENNELLKKIINSRVEEIIELLFSNCPFLKNNTFDNGLKLYFLGNGSKVLNENLLSFGSDFSFISEMSMINQKKEDCCDATIKFINSIETIQPKKINLSLENKGFFEKLFEYFTNK